MKKILAFTIGAFTVFSLLVLAVFFSVHNGSIRLFIREDTEKVGPGSVCGGYAPCIALDRRSVSADPGVELIGCGTIGNYNKDSEEDYL